MILMPVAHSLDSLRGRLLRFTLGMPVFHRVFFERSSRLASLFAVATLGALITAIFFPLWVLVIGPMVYGFPHLIATFRYFSFVVSPSQANHLKRRQLLLGFLTLAYFALAGLRVLEELNGNQGSYLPLRFLSSELGLTLALLIIGLWFRQTNSRRWLRGLIIVTPVLVLGWYFPLWVAGAMILIHNAIAFVYWIGVSKTKSERRVAWLAFSSFLIITAAIFYGTFDPLYKLFVPSFELPWAKLAYYDLGKMILPIEPNYLLWFHCVVAYAFGQSIHYFVWLKAIPEQCHTRNVPTTFQASLNLLKSDYGRLFFLVGVFVVGGLGVWLLVEQPLARTIYFSFAAYHGYVEIAGLAFVPFKRDA